MLSAILLVIAIFLIADGRWITGALIIIISFNVDTKTKNTPAPEPAAHQIIIQAPPATPATPALSPALEKDELVNEISEHIKLHGLPSQDPCGFWQNITKKTN